MNNMFYGLNKKTKPKNLNQTIQADPVSEELWSWARTQENIALYGGIIAAIITVIVFIVIGIDNEEPTVCIVGFLAGLLVGIIFYCVNHAHALRTAALAAIVHNTNISANIDIYRESKSGTNVESTVNEEATDTLIKKSPIPQNSGWVCKKCGIRNANNSKFCINCGSSSPEPSTQQPKATTQHTQGTSHKCKCGERFIGNLCPNCGREYINL